MLILIIVLLIVPTVHAQRITNMRAEVELRKDGSALINEADTVRGSSFLHRAIPLEIVGGVESLNRWNREINLLSVRNSNGDKLPYRAGVHQGHFVLDVPLSVSAADATVLLTYEVRHSIVVYWEASSASFDFSFTDNQDWPVPFDEVVVTATVPEDPRGGLEAGLNNSGQPSSVSIHGRTARLTRKDIPAGYHVKLWLSVPSSMISLPVREWVHQEVVRTFAALLFLCGLGAAYVWYKRSMEREINAAIPDYNHSRNVVIPPPTIPDDNREKALRK